MDALSTAWSSPFRLLLILDFLLLLQHFYIPAQLRSLAYLRYFLSLLKQHFYELRLERKSTF